MMLRGTAGQERLLRPTSGSKDDMTKPLNRSESEREREHIEYESYGSFTVKHDQRKIF